MDIKCLTAIPLKMLHINFQTLRKLIRKFDADGSGKLEFDEFCALVYTVANTVDKETLEKELREAFRLFDKEVPLNFIKSWLAYHQLIELSLYRRYF